MATACTLLYFVCASNVLPEYKQHNVCDSKMDCLALALNSYMYAYIKFHDLCLIANDVNSLGKLKFDVYRNENI